MNDINAVGAHLDRTHFTPAELKRVHKLIEIEKNRLKERGNAARESQKSIGELKKLIYKDDPEVDIEEILEEIKKFNNGIDDKEIKLSYNEEIDRVIITVLNKHSHEIIAVYPCEELQHLARHLKEMIGIIFDKEA